MKIAKPIYRSKSEFWVGAYMTGIHRERCKAVDEEHKPYVRCARNEHHLPDGFTNTKWIRRKKSWKHRVKKKRQWVKHFVSWFEEKLFSEGWW